MVRLPKAFNRTPGNTVSLRRWDGGVAVVYALQAIVIVILSSASSMPVSFGYAQIDRLTSAADAGTALVPVLQQIGSWQYSYLIAAFLGLAAITHALIATRLRDRYERELPQGINRFRWIGFAATAGLMLITVAGLAGVSDLALLVTLFGLGAITNLSAMLTELHAANRPKRTPVAWGNFWLAGASCAIGWIIIAIYLFATQNSGAGIGAWTWAAAGVTFILSAHFPVVMALQLRQYGRLKDAITSEKVYLLLGLAAKSALAWLTFAAILS